MNLVEARTYFQEMGQSLRSEPNRAERKRYLELTRQEPQYQDAFSILRQEALSRKQADKDNPRFSCTSPTEKIRNRGLSAELAIKFPYLEIMHFCASAYGICDLKRGKPDDFCIQTDLVCIGSSKSKGSNWVATKMIPEPGGCKACPLTKAS